MWRGVGDLVCFGGFFAVGAAVHHKRWEIARIERVQLLVACVAVTAFATWVAPPADMVVNNSNVSMALVGMCWLLVIALFEEPLRHFGSIAAGQRVLRWVTDRSMTVYLWHTLAICVTYSLVGPTAGLTGSVIFSAVFTVLLVALVTAVHPFESIGGRRRANGRGVARYGAPRWRTRGAAGAVAGGARRSRPRSRRCSRPTIDVLGPPGTVGPTRSAVTARGRGRRFDRDRAPSDPVTQVGSAAASATDAAALAARPRRAHGLVYAYDGDAPARRGSTCTVTAPTLSVDERFEVLSITKTMIAAVALQLVDDGVLTLDEPLPPIDGLPAELTDGETLRRLLAHASGLDRLPPRAHLRPRGRHVAARRGDDAPGR